MSIPKSKIQNPKSFLPLIVITGPTASGKTGLALRLAERWGGEIICADSRTVYKGMDIGTAKPTLDEQKRVPHWLLDVVSPDERFTVADFQELAYAAIDDIRGRGKIPLLVGGTGLYIDAVVLGFEFGQNADEQKRAELEKLSIPQLKSLITSQQLPMPENENNKRYLIRCIEKNNVYQSVKNQPDATTTVVAVMTEKDELRQRITERAEMIFASEIVQETQRLIDKYGTGSEALKSNIYPIIEKMIAGEIDETAAKELSVTRDWQLAKRQMTWLRRHDFVRWLSLAAAESYIDAALSDFEAC